MISKIIVVVGFLCLTVLSSWGKSPAAYFSCVNWDYRHRNDLVGWKNTSHLIHASLKEWEGDLGFHSIENVNVGGLGQFQEVVAGTKADGLKMVYLASHQTPSGKFDFPDEMQAHWEEGFEGGLRNSGNPSILLLDVCYADVLPQSRMRGVLPFHFLLTASAPHQETYELRMFSRRPVDYRRRFPEEVKWMKNQLGPEWRGRVSFLGFIWVRQYLRTPRRPRNQLEWGQFLDGMADESARFTRQRSGRFASALSVWR